MAITKYKGDFILLAEAGFIAVNQSDEDSAWKLFRAAEVLDEENVLPLIGIGYLHLHKMELKQATESFEKALKLDPKNEMAKALKGLCISLTPSEADKGEKILKASLKSKDPSIKKMAGTAIDFVEKFVKKHPGPAGRNR